MADQTSSEIPTTPSKIHRSVTESTPLRISSQGVSEATIRSQESLMDILEHELKGHIYESESLLETIYPDGGTCDDAISALYEKEEMVSLIDQLDTGDERAVYAPLAHILNEIVKLVPPDERGYHKDLTFLPYDKEMKDKADGLAPLKPDGLGVSKETGAQDRRYYWAQVQIAVEIKNSWRRMILQGASYARSMLEKSPILYGLFFAFNHREGTFRFCWCHADGLHHTPSYKLSEESGFKSVARGIVGYMKCDKRRAGRDRHHIIKDGKHYFRVPTSDNKGSWWVAKRSDVLCRRVGVRGRKTHVYRLTRVRKRENSGTTEDVVDKLASGLKQLQLSGREKATTVFGIHGLRERSQKKAADPPNSKPRSAPNPGKKKKQAVQEKKAASSTKCIDKKAKLSYPAETPPPPAACDDSPDADDTIDGEPWELLSDATTEDWEAIDIDVNWKSPDKSHPEPQLASIKSAAGEPVPDADTVSAMASSTAPEPPLEETRATEATPNSNCGQNLPEQIVFKDSMPMQSQADIEAKMFKIVRGRHGVPDVVGVYVDNSVLKVFSELKDLKLSPIFGRSAGKNAKNGTENSMDSAEALMHDGRVQARLICLTEGRSLLDLQLGRCVRAIIDGIIGHLHLFLEGWLHRDVSIGNVLTRQEPEIRDEAMRRRNNELLAEPQFDFLQPVLRACLGFIIDGDLAIEYKEIRLLRKDRSGTLPFMSRPVLKAWRRRETFLQTAVDDLESFAWVLLWSVLHSLESRTPMEDDWISALCDDSIRTVSTMKSDIIDDFSESMTSASCSEPIKRLQPLLKEWFTIAHDSSNNVRQLCNNATASDLGADWLTTELRLLCLETYRRFLLVGVDWLRANAPDMLELGKVGE